MQSHPTVHATTVELLARALEGLCRFERSAPCVDACSHAFLGRQLLSVVEQRAAQLQDETRALRRDLPEL